MTENLTTQECEREFRADEKLEARTERKFDESIRYSPSGSAEMPEPKEAEFFRAALDLSNALGLLASGELNAAKLEDRLALHRLFGNAENVFSKVRREFYHACISARRAEDKE